MKNAAIRKKKASAAEPAGVEGRSAVTQGDDSITT